MKVKARQGDGCFLEANLVLNASFKVMDTMLVLCKFARDEEVLDTGNSDIILGFCRLRENGFSVDT